MKLDLRQHIAFIRANVLNLKSANAIPHTGSAGAIADAARILHEVGDADNVEIFSIITYTSKLFIAACCSGNDAHLTCDRVYRNCLTLLHSESHHPKVVEECARNLIAHMAYYDSVSIELIFDLLFVCGVTISQLRLYSTALLAVNTSAEIQYLKDSLTHAYFEVISAEQDKKDTLTLLRIFKEHVCSRDIKLYHDHYLLS